MVIISKDGKRHDVILHASAVFNDKGEILHSVSIQTDITERKKMEKALRESEVKFRGIAERSYDAIFWLEPDGRISYASPSAERLSGYTVDGGK